MAMKTSTSQRGATLIEALVALLVMSLSLLAATKLQSWLQLQADLARERSDAVRLAQQDMERLRAFGTLSDFDQAQALRTDTPTSTTRLSLHRDVVEIGGFKTIQSTVGWLAGGGAQEIHLVSGVARLAPVYSAALDLQPQDRALAVRRQLPFGARTLPDGRTVVRPTPTSTVAWIVNDTTGDITQQCAIAAAAGPQPLRAADLGDCEPFIARLLRGYIRFSLSSTPDPLRANDPPLALRVRAGETRCEAESVHADGDRYIAYACAVTSTGDGALDVTMDPLGWSFGANAQSFKSCRYPHAGRGPRNYLVVRGDLDCPVGLPPHNGEPVVTVQHQP